VNRLLSLGLSALACILIAGIWLVIAPWVMKIQLARGVWPPGAVVNLLIGVHCQGDDIRRVGKVSTIMGASLAVLHGCVERIQHMEEAPLSCRSSWHCG
jgi:hypothetical protein